MIAAELGGNGVVTPELLALAKRGLRSCLAHLGHLDEAPVPAAGSLRVEIRDPGHKVYASEEALFEPLFAAGETVREGAVIGRLHALDEPARPPTPITSPASGVILASSARGYLRRGDFICLIATELGDQT
jgi:predicted deacylase